MAGPYKECAGCLAIPFCKVYAGDVTPSYLDWCRGKFRLDKALELSQIPEDYREANLHNFKVDEYNDERYADLAAHTMDVLATVDEGRNFFIFGPKTGTGKTYWATAFMNHYIYKACMTDRFDFENPLALFVFYPELMHELRYTRDDEELDRKMDLVRNVPLLLLDDVGAGTNTDFSREQTTLILNYRMNHHLSTIVTSNYKVSQLREETRMGSRIASRLVARATGIEMVGRDRRIGS